MTSIASEYNADIFITLWRLVMAAPTSAFNALKSSYEKAQAERELGAMDDAMLKDIGISRNDIHNKVWGIN